MTMWTLQICVLMCCVGVGMGVGAGVGAVLQCSHARCRYVGGGAGGGTNDHEFSVNGSRVVIDYRDSKYLQVQCNGEPVLDSPALPSFVRGLRVPLVSLSRCPPPGAGGSFARALAALNATLLFSEFLGNLSLEFLPPEPPLDAIHFVGLEGLVSLKLSVSGSEPRRPAPARGFLAGLRRLRSLTVQGVALPPGELEAPPPALRVLSLRDTGAARVPAGVLALPALRELMLSERSLAEFAPPAALRTLAVDSNATALRLADIPALESVTLYRWAEPAPAPLARCGSLRALLLSAPALAALPPRWVAACPRLERLALTFARRLEELPAALLAGAGRLAELKLRHGALRALPPALLDAAPALRRLDLAGNRLLALPSGMFAGPRALQALDLSSNRLDGAALQAAAALRDLVELRLGDNPRIGDVCESGYSDLILLTKLTFLSLNKTNVTRICRDWREAMPFLRVLDLRNTAVSDLTFDDLQYRRNETVLAAEVRLQGAPVAAVRYSEADYARAEAASASAVRVLLDSKLECDCDMYWTRLALERPNGGVLPKSLRCSSGRSLRDTAADEMLCPAPDECARAALPRACACAARPAARGALVVQARCERAALRRAPRPAPARARRYRLLLAGNRIAALRAADLPPAVEVLDLRNNSIRNVDEETAARLGRLGGLLLAGNPLACDCSGAPLLRALRGLGAAADLHAAACADGSAAAAARTERCAARVPPAAWAAAALAALLALAAAAAAYFAPPERRVFLKVVLRRWGVLRRGAEPDDGRPFDAFLSFAHEDEAVARQLVARLEGGPAPYRLCLHYRDWVPGCWIPQQIVTSVSRSRRTVALVSRAFLRSRWACAEVREAHAAALRDAAPRLVLVLLDPPRALPLDRALRRYVATNTYVLWGDPWFWEKLKDALPPPRPPASAPASPPASPSDAAVPTEAVADRPLPDVQISNSICDAEPAAASPSPPPAAAADPPRPPAAFATHPRPGLDVAVAV